MMNDLMNIYHVPLYHHLLTVVQFEGGDDVGRGIARLLLELNSTASQLNLDQYMNATWIDIMLMAQNNSYQRYCQ